MPEIIEQFELRGKHEQAVEMPTGSCIFGVGVQNGEVYLYATCEKDAPKIKRHFIVVTNGEGLPEEPRHYVGSFYLPGIVGPHFTQKPYVGHVYTDRKEYPL